MAVVKVYDQDKTEQGELTLTPEVFEVAVRPEILHLVVRAQLAAKRAGTHSTKTRAMVSGGGVKPWRQKGTGRARQGTTRAPQWRGGGVVFGPQPRSYSFRVNNKEVKLAMRSALSAKLADEQFIVVSGFEFEKPSTKGAVAALKALGVDGRRVTLVIEDDDVNTFLSFRNIPTVNILPVSCANTYELIDNKALVFTEAALKRIEEVLA